MKTFSFLYYAARNTVSVDEFMVKVQMGPLMKREFEPSAIQNFCLFKTSQYQALILTYRDTGGKVKKIQVYSNLNEASFTEMIQYLDEKFKDRSLSHLPQQEALKMMNVTNPNKLGFVIAFFLITICMTIFFYPMLRHYFDHGHVKVTIEEYMARPDLGTKNLTITGSLLDVGVKQTITSSKGGSSSSTYIPMVSSDWKEGDPVKVILEFGSLSSTGFDEVTKQTEFTGVIRDVWWEGISSDNVEFLKDKYKLAFPETPVLIEVTGSTENDGFVIWVWGGTIVLILVIVLIAAWKMRVKK